MDSNSQFIPDGMNMIERLAKRFFDCIIALACIIVFSPLFLIIYLMVKSDHNGPAIYKQERIGLHGKPFYIYKFRSMKVDSEENEPLLLTEERKHLITRKGMFLRRHHLDELPQLFNILKGDMSIVGNRPLPLYEAEKLTVDSSIDRFMAPAGLTGLWQVEERGKGGNMSAEERKQLDITYGQTYNFILDMKIIFRTLTAFIQKENV